MASTGAEVGVCSTSTVPANDLERYIAQLGGIALLEISASEHGGLWTPISPFHLGGSGTNELWLSCSYLHPAEIVAGVNRLAGFFRKVGISPG